MAFKYRAITANCGNDAIGMVAGGEIARLLAEDNADFYVINCQEVHFENTQKQLEALVSEGYKVECLGQMATHTKLDTQFHSNTGIASFIIYKNDLVLSKKTPREARRSPGDGLFERLSSGPGYNKGGLVTDFSITRNGECIDAQAVSGHLDASNILKRNRDWHVLHKATIKEVTNWDDLVAACPNLLLSGYDVNTRHRVDEQGQEVNMWDDPSKYPEIHGIHRVSLAAAQYSGESTYNHIRGPDPKRVGYTGYGMLDFVAIHDGTISKNGIVADGRVTQIEPEPDSERDHTVVISPPHTSLKFTPFEQVKNLMASRLYGVAPLLAEQIQKMQESDVGVKEQLIKIYQDYLGPEGFLDKAIALHQSKLECFQRLHVSLDEPLKKELSTVLFGELEWCAGDPKQLAAKQELMQALLDSLAQCEHGEGVRARLDCYSKLKEKIDNKEEIKDIDNLFKDAAVKAYQDLYTSFAEKQASRPLKHAMNKILKRLDAIADHNDEGVLKNMDPKKLDTLTHIIAQCNNNLSLLQKGEMVEMHKVNEDLVNLSHKAMGSSSSLWRALASAVKFFASVIDAMSSDSELATKIDIVQDHNLSDSIMKYKSALQDMRPKEDTDDENRMDFGG